MKRLSILLVALLALAVAACSSDQASLSSSAATTAATPSPSPSQAEPSEPAATASADAGGDLGALPSFELPNSAPELLAILPEQVGGASVVPGFGELSQTGDEFMADGDAGGNEEFIAFLGRMGAQASDVSVAMRLYGDMENPEAITSIFAFRVEGANSDQLLDEMQTAFEEGEEGLSWESRTIDGKSVQAAILPAPEGGSLFVYVREDIVFAITATEEPLVEDALGQLP